MLLSIDIETACSVEGCKYHGKSICPEGHSLSPWHSEITVIGAVSDDGAIQRVFRGPTMINDLQMLIDAHPDAEIGGHNFKFDLLHLWVKGLKLPLDRWTWDTQLAAYVLTEKIPDEWLADYEERRKLAGPHHRKASKHSLKTLAPYFLDVDPFWEAAEHDNDDYVLSDARYTARLHTILRQKLAERGELDFYSSRLLPWTKMLLEAEFRGVQLDMEGLTQKEVELTQKAKELKAKLDEMWAPAHKAYYLNQCNTTMDRYFAMTDKAKQRAKDPGAARLRYAKLADAAVKKIPWGVDYDSPKQMAWLLRDYLGYNITSLEGDETTGREVLERLAEEGHDDVKTYLEWRKTNKILTAFLPTYKELATRLEPNNHDGGPRPLYGLHPIFNPTSTRTGRTSSERPNAQQIPPSLRPLIKAREGYSLVGYDAGAIEAKLIALYSEDPTLFQIIDQGISIHDYNTVQFLGLDADPSDVKANYPTERAATKNVGFALFYNAGVNRIRVAYAQKGFHLSQAECKRIHERFKRAYAPAYEYANQVVRHMERGEVLLNLLGRPLRIENPDDCYMQAFNTLIQSSASDLMLYGAWLAHEEYKKAGIDGHPVLFVHDFACFEVKDEHVAEANEILVRCLTDFNLETRHGKIKLTVDGGVMKRWEK